MIVVKIRHLRKSLLRQAPFKPPRTDLITEKPKRRRCHLGPYSHLTVRRSTQYIVNMPNDLTRRRHVELELPGFLVAALEHFIATANAEIDDGAEDMDLTEFVTIHFVGLLEPSEVADLERKIPGFEDALTAHLMGNRLTDRE